jgi:signal transduction histidine kinase
LELESDSFHHPVFMDEVHMSTAVNNLLSNAVKYGHRPCKLHVRARRDNGSLVIIVSDNGPGIPREELKHVFEKFYRGRDAKKRVIKGLGLGLYYVRQIAEAHGGGISARSTPGKGTQFILKIPVNHEHTPG